MTINIRKNKKLKAINDIFVKLHHNSRKKLTQVNWPQIANYSFIVLILITALLNFHGRVFPENEQPAVLKQAILEKPFEAKAHQALGNYFLNHNQIASARKEFKLASLFGFRGTAGIFSAVNSKKESLKKEIYFWEKIIQNRPDYRDAYLKLAALYSQLRENESARDYLQKAYVIDPSCPEVKKLQETLAIKN